MFNFGQTSTKVGFTATLASLIAYLPAQYQVYAQAVVSLVGVGMMIYNERSK